MKTDLNHQLVVVSDDVEQGGEGSVARSLRKTREELFNEKYFWNWPNAVAFRALEKIANTLQSVSDEVAVIFDRGIGGTHFPARTS
ncbi:TPA: hypothetical protein SL218_006169 [Pseudomonas aeruginosa]|nr:hypothetical protein [Pseudomonas aeruginosa]HEJ2775897.1 hypothetical protein [Pseudomonas aeruginosa]